MKHVKKAAVLVLCLVLVVPLFSCGSSSRSEYDDATVSIPDSYATYHAGEFTFRFEPGWTSTSWDDTQSVLDAQTQILSISNNLAFTWRLTSPVRAIGTTDYVDFGYFSVSGTVTTKDLESLMPSLDEQASSLKKLGVSCEILQNSRIRSYNNASIEALTFCYKVTSGKVTTVVQTALISGGSKVYAIMYSDFTSGADSSMLEQLLSTLVIS